MLHQLIFIKKVCENFPWWENCLQKKVGLIPFAYGNIICCIYLSQHIHPWQKQGRVAGCLWHKRPEPGLDPSRLWEKKKRNVRRGLAKDGVYRDKCLEKRNSLSHSEIQMCTLAKGGVSLRVDITDVAWHKDTFTSITHYSQHTCTHTQ